MALFTRKFDTYPDLSADLHDQSDWLIGELKHWEFAQDLTSIAVDPVYGLLAAGTIQGNIYIFGKPGVSVTIAVPERIGVKFLQFACSTGCLVCIDDHNRLHLWDLNVTRFGCPKHLSTASFDKVTALTLSPSHSHAFICLQSGVIRTFDLQCRRKSQYITKNLWQAHLDYKALSGAAEAYNPLSGVAIDAVIHPRNLNLLFVAYSAGIVLFDVTVKNTLRVYELLIPPGAPGGLGYADPQIFHPRKPEVTSITIHPSGHFFVVGYTDGILAFWAMEDEVTPLLVRTFDDLDVDQMDPNGLEQHLGENKGKTTPIMREPIFKMSWSAFSDSTDPRGGKTSLTVLGGLRTGDAPGLMVLALPAFNPPEPPTPAVEGALHPFFRTAMRESLDPLDAYLYATTEVVQDYLLVPKSSPHFNNTFDPIALLVITDANGGTRAIQGHQFPPPSFKTQPVSASQSGDIVDNLSSTLAEMELGTDPRKMRLPWALSTDILGGQLVVVERDSHEKLLSDGNVPFELRVPLKGGASWNNEVDLKGSKFQPPRILITHSSDLTIRFYDASTQLLLPVHPEPIDCDFPDPLAHLTIDVTAALSDPSVASRVLPTSSIPVGIHSVHFASESLDVAVVLTTGDLLFYRLSQDQRRLNIQRDLDDNAYVSLEHLNFTPSSRYIPACLFSPVQGQVTAFALSDIGFLSVGYANGALFIIDLRGPSTMLYSNPFSQRRSRASFIPGHRSVDPVASLTWAASPLSSEKNSGIRLVAVRASGHAEVYTLQQKGSGWTCPTDFIKVDGVEDPFPEGTCVLDRKTGGRTGANRYGLTNVQNPIGINPTYLVVAGAKNVKTFDCVDGERIAGTHWAGKVKVKNVKIVEKLGSSALVAFTEEHQILAYSIPHLEPIGTFPVPKCPSFAMDKSGDFIGWDHHPKSGMVAHAVYGTLFNQRRVLPTPDIDLAVNKSSIPAQPQPASMGPASFFGSWLGGLGSQSITGAQVDEILGGPDRPIPEPSVPAQRPGMQGNAVSFEGAQKGAASLLASAQQTHSTLYSRLTSALNERGQMLGNLEDQFNSLEQGSKTMVDQAKRLAAEQSAKQTARGWLPF
ncbi:hypothetical protein CYLTODRAFT_365694 [Cylindrobasidium torrendii FP15055 ss-10]|uniref:Lethal giant larvae (Lgl)-like C-terminal domain-containing protein n=1 Tax=Cylindrobasidium torrendii FP15055 ss-10 TaxID=1314674 RepID=A0A0D7BT31_9AGAR|nr:hypothetical protein CYLTODRAFT_365694 [Cylindrobasidium torrendii FP15055 ss-10]